MNDVLIKLIITLFASGQGLICLFSFLSLIFVSYARKSFKNGILKEMIDNLLSLAFVTYLFTFFNILIKGKYMVMETLTGEFILNVFLVLILTVIIKTTVDIVNYSKINSKVKKVNKKARNKSKKRKSKR